VEVSVGVLLACAAGAVAGEVLERDGEELEVNPHQEGA
jgi:hypothetical protein